MRERINTIIDSFNNMPLATKVGIYVAGYILSHFSISIIYQLALYNYSSLLNVPFLYANEISISDIYPSLIYLKIPYLVLSLLLYFVTISVVKAYSNEKNKNSLLKKKYNSFIGFFKFEISESNLHHKIMETESGKNLALLTGSIFITYIILDNNNSLQQLVIIFIQYLIPIYFGYKFSTQTHYVTLFFSIIPILLFFASLSLFVSPIFNRVMVDNKIGGNLPILIYDKVNKEPIEAKLMLLTNKNIVIEHLGYIKVLNKRDLGTINFRVKANTVK